MDTNEPSKCRHCNMKSYCIPYDYYFRPHAELAHNIECLLICSPALFICFSIVVILGITTNEWFISGLIFAPIALVILFGVSASYGNPKMIECGHFQHNLPGITGRTYDVIKNIIDD